MLITFNFVQSENFSAAFRELLHGATQRNSVDSAKEAWIRFPHVPTQRWRVRRNGLVKRQDWGRFAAAQLHQHSVHRHPVQPGRKGRVAAERTHAAEYLQKSFLGKVFGIGYIFRHQKTHGIHTLLMALEKRGKSLLIAILRALNQATFVISVGFFPDRNY